MTSSNRDRLSRAAEQAGVTVTEKGKGHFHLRGQLLVNYYPDSPKQTAYVAGMKGSYNNITPEQAVAMCFVQPQSLGKSKRNKNISRRRREKLILLRRHPFCHWCNIPLTYKTATFEHIIPLAIGGLDNLNNMCLACKPCNHKRGCTMIELNPKDDPPWN